VRPLEDRTYVVTGSASGIGQATALLLRERGARVIGVDLRDADVLADVASADGRAALVSGVVAAAGDAIDALVICAGVANDPVAAIAINHFGAVATIEGLQPLLAAGQDPRVAVVASGSVVLPHDAELLRFCLDGDERGALRQAQSLSTAIAYATSKLAVVRWLRTQALKVPYREPRILLNAIAPGNVKTPMSRMFWEDPESEASAALATSVPMPLVGGDGWIQPSELSELLAWLTSPQNSVMSGQVLFSDGGFELTLRGDDVIVPAAGAASPEWA
jgi:NAD(P)-dependent dehydrogenase (short-subunit alcohol dehydrogenase family)